MRSRPWPIIILSWIYFLAPLPNVLVAAMLQGLGPVEYLEIFVQGKMWADLAKVFLLFPAAGLAIYSCKRWSYLAYLSISSWALFSSYDNWVAFPDVFTLPILIGSYALNIGVVSYFLIPAVRTTYFNARVRWWESPTRYKTTFDGEMDEAPCKIENVSRGGVYLKSDREHVVNDLILLKFKAFNMIIQIQARVAHVGPGIDGIRGYGLEFLNTKKDKEAHAAVHRLVELLERMGSNIISARDATDGKGTLRGWLAGLFSTGEGIVPEIPTTSSSEENQEKVEPTIEISKKKAS